MNITSKSKYALRAVIHLAKADSGIIRREDLAAAQGGISTEYLEKILLRLRERNLLVAKSGPGGGYRLARLASEITAWDVISTVEESPAPVSCLDRGAPSCNGDCEAKILWKKVWDAAVTEMKLTTIASLVQEEETLHNDEELYKHIGLVPCR